MKSTKKIKSNKIFNGETINYSLFYVICFMLFLVAKQLLKGIFGIDAEYSVGIAFGIAAAVFYVFEKALIFNIKAKSPTLIQIVAYIFRTAVDVGFFLICKFFMCTVLKLESFVPYFVTIFLLYYFNYYFDRLIVFNCVNKPENRNNGRLYKLFYQNRFVLLSGLITAVSLLLIYLVFNVFPFGNVTVLRMDLYHQYGPLFTELYDRITLHKSFLYSWNSGGGSSFLGNYFNYLSSPFAFIILLFDRMHIAYAITIMVLVKAIASAGTFTYYIKRSLNSHSYSSAAFGVMYALSAYFLAYYWNIMWLDGMILLPIIALGIESIIKKGNPTTYIASLVLLLYSSYYTGYMSCIFAVLYFLAYFVISDVPGHISPAIDEEQSLFQKLKNITFLNRGVIFGLSSVACGVLCACALVPVFLILQGSSATSGSFPTTFESYFDILDLFKSHICALETTIRSSGDDVLPNVYCGVLTVLLVPLYFLNKDIRLKEKAVYLLLLLVFVISFNNNMLNYIWHAMHFPNDLPYRFSYMYSFVLLVIAYRGIKKISSLRYQDIVGVGILWLLIIMLFQKEPTNKMAEDSIYISLVFVIIWTGVLLLVQQKKFSKLVIGVAILSITFSEVVVSDMNSFDFGATDDSYTMNYKKHRECANYIREHDDSFYRSELCYLDTRMDPCIYNYDGISVFSSMAYEDYSQNQYSVGMMGNRINSYTYNTQTPVYNMMYGIKYLTWTAGSIVPSSDIYTRIYTTNDGSAEVYENKYPMSISFLTPNDIKDWDNEEGNPFDVQSDFIKKATGASDLYIPAEYGNTTCYECTCDDVTENGTYFASKSESDNTSGTIDITVKAVMDGELFVYVSSNDITNINYYWNDNEDTHYQSIDEPYIMNLGEHKKGDEVTVSLDIGSMDSSEGYFDIFAYNMDKSVFESAYELLKSCSLDVTEHNDTTIVGTINAGYDGYLYSSIPYDKSWSVYIDGVKQKTFDIGDSQLATTIKKGKHTVKYKYTPRGFRLGVGVTTIGYTLLLLYLLFRKKLKRKFSTKQIC